MKRVFLFVLVLCTLLTTIPAIGVNALSPEREKKVDFPSSFTLVGTKHLPPISNQGNIGTCSSSSITYMQFTNAVSRYLHSIDPDIEWDPSSGESKYIFSPKFTYNFAGSGTEWVYRILMENGALTWDKSFFATKADGSYDQEAVKLDIPTQTTSWDVGTGAMESAMQYRLNNFEQIWLRPTDDSYGVDGNLMITQTEKGQELINKVKQSLNEGNVVVTGGLSSTWGGGYELNAVVADTNLAKKGESVLYCGRGDKAGGHQVCIVGYDDDLVAAVTNVDGTKTHLRGAFLVANSWGDGWQNDGYCWFMYDSLNEISEYEELNFDDREAPIDQFCFVDWDKDVTVGLPDLYMEVNVITCDRTGFNITMIAQNEAGLTKRYEPYLFKYAGHHGDYGERRDYNFAGQPVRKGIVAAGQFAFPCNELYGKDINRFVKYGVKVTSKLGEEVKVVGITLKNSSGKVLSKVSFNGAEGIVTSEKEFLVDIPKLISHDELPKIEGATINYFDVATYYAMGSKIRFTVTPDDDNAKAVISLNDVVLKADKDGVYTAELTEAFDLKADIQSIPNVPSDDGTGNSGNQSGGENNTDIGGNQSDTENGQNSNPGNKNDDSGFSVIWIFVGVAVVMIVAVGVIIIKKSKRG